MAVLWRGQLCVGLVYHETAHYFSIFITRNKGGGVGKGRENRQQKSIFFGTTLRAAFVLEMWGYKPEVYSNCINGTTLRQVVFAPATGSGCYGWDREKGEA